MIVKLNAYLSKKKKVMVNASVKCISYDNITLKKEGK